MIQAIKDLGEYLLKKRGDSSVLTTLLDTKNQK